MKTLREDLNQPLLDVERNWLRKSVTGILAVLLLPITVILGLIETFRTWWVDFVVCCWVGNKNK